MLTLPTVIGRKSGFTRRCSSFPSCSNVAGHVHVQATWLLITKNIPASHQVATLDLTWRRTCSLVEFQIIGWFLHMLLRDPASSVGNCPFSVLHNFKCMHLCTITNNQSICFYFERVSYILDTIKYIQSIFSYVLCCVLRLLPSVWHIFFVGSFSMCFWPMSFLCVLAVYAVLLVWLLHSVHLSQFHFLF